MAALDMKTFFLLVFGALFFLAWWQNNSLSNRIHCIFRNKDRRDEEKQIPIKDNKVTYKGGVYEVDPRRFTLFKYSRGIIGMLFPVMMPSLHFNWSSRVAENPDDFTYTWDTPDARAIADSRADWKGMNSGIDTQTGKKLNLGGSWMMWIGVIIIVGIVWFTYQNYNHIKTIEAYLQAGGSIPGVK